MTQGSHQDERDDGHRSVIIEEAAATMPCGSADIPHHYDNQLHQAVKAWLENHARKLAQAERERDEARAEVVSAEAALVAADKVVKDSERVRHEARALLREALGAVIWVSIQTGDRALADRINALLAGQPAPGTLVDAIQDAFDQLEKKGT